jgi:hypothetical protein
MSAALALSLAGCVSSDKPTTIKRTMPALPAFATPVVVPDPEPGDDARVVGMRERIGRVENGRRLKSLGVWYLDVAKRVSGGE